MAKTLNNQFRRVKVATEYATPSEYPVEGFVFDDIDVQGENVWGELHQPLEGMNVPNGFAYEYEGKLYGTHKSISHSKI